MIDWIATALSIAGAYYNMRLKAGGFALWIVANVLWLLYLLPRGEYGGAVLFAAYSAISLRGLILWRRAGVPWW